MEKRKLRILIVTLVFYNFGTKLQTYALCLTLKRLLDKDTDIQVLNTTSSWAGNASLLGNRGKTSKISFLIKLFKNYKFHSFKKLLEQRKWKKESLEIGNTQSNNEKTIKRKEKFKEIDSIIPYTKYYSHEEIRNDQSLTNYDIYIVGSDQVWNFNKVLEQDIYTLDFLEKKEKTYISYAASFGVKRIPSYLTSFYKEKLKKFDSILVREIEGKNIISNLNLKSNLVLDPTLLLDLKDYEEITKKERIIKEPYVLVYSLNRSYKIYDEAQKICNKYNLKLIVLKRSFCPPIISEGNELYEISPEDFLTLIKQSEITITNSYHAVIFSIIFHKLFFAFLDNMDDENSRITTLLDLLHLNKQIFYETNHIKVDNKTIDYNLVDDILKSEKEKSLHLLKKSLHL